IYRIAIEPVDFRPDSADCLVLIYIMQIQSHSTSLHHICGSSLIADTPFKHRPRDIKKGAPQTLLSNESYCSDRPDGALRSTTYAFGHPGLAATHTAH